jgi:heme exporter protein A
MLQRLSIARALIHDPTILFLDEPFTGLDQHAAETLKRSLSRLHNENRTIVMITHNLKLGLEMGTRVALQVAGKIQLDQPSDKLDHTNFEEVYFKAVGEAHY